MFLHKMYLVIVNIHTTQIFEEIFSHIYYLVNFQELQL